MKKVKKSLRVYPEGKVHTLFEKNQYSAKTGKKVRESIKQIRNAQLKSGDLNSNWIKSEGYI